MLFVEGIPPKTICHFTVKFTAV